MNCEENYFLNDQSMINYYKSCHQNDVNECESRISKKNYDISKYEVAAICEMFGLCVEEVNRKTGGAPLGSGDAYDISRSSFCAQWEVRTATQSAQVRENSKKPKTVYTDPMLAAYHQDRNFSILRMHVNQRGQEYMPNVLYRLYSISGPAVSSSPRAIIDPSGPGEVAFDSTPWPYFFCRGNVAFSMEVRMNGKHIMQRPLKEKVDFDLFGLMKALDDELQKCPVREYADFFLDFPHLTVQTNKANVVGEHLVIPYELSAPLKPNQILDASHLWMQDAAGKNKENGTSIPIGRLLTLDAEKSRILISLQGLTTEEIKEPGIFFFGIKDTKTMMSRIERIQYPARK